MTAVQADIVCRLIDAATDSNWPNTRDTMLEAGFNPEEIEESVGALCDIAGINNIISAGDF